jgi:predicted transcriptional regulator
LIAIKSQEFKPSLVILHGVSEVDLLALELSEQMKIPLAVTKTGSVDNLIRDLRGIKP